MLWGLVVGLQLSLASYVFGEQCALVIDRYCVTGGVAETDSRAMLQMCVAGSTYTCSIQQPSHSLQREDYMGMQTPLGC